LARWYQELDSVCSPPASLLGADLFDQGIAGWEVGQL